MYLSELMFLFYFLGYILEWDCFHKENNSVNEVINVVQFTSPYHSLMSTGPC